MRKYKLSLIALTLAVCGSANAGLVGNKATVDAPITVSASNNTTAVWSAENIGTNGFADWQKLGSLTITATGSHDAINISGEGAQTSGGHVRVPFKDAQGSTVFYGRTNGKELSNSGIDGLAGWSHISSEETPVAIEVYAAGQKASLNPGTYTAKFYIQQWQN